MPALLFSEEIKTTLALAVLLRDAYTGGLPLGELAAAIPDVENGKYKPNDGSFIFRTAGPGAHTVEVRSKEDPPFYLPVDIAVTLPLADPLWPAFPDRSLADSTLPFESPLQPVLFRAQYLQAALLPSTRYPFPGDATLVRGTISSGTGPLDQAIIRINGEKKYETGLDGEYVVFLARYQPTVTLEVARPGFANANIPVIVQAQSTTIMNVLMTP